MATVRAASGSCLAPGRWLSMWDRDVIHVGRREGRFTAITLRADHNTVHIEDLRIVDGDVDDVNVPSDHGCATVEVYGLKD
jgi:hypothetical protein